MQKIVVLVGLPGSGKSTWAASRGWNALSSDTLRWMLADDMEDQTIHGQVFAALRYLLRVRVGIGRAVTCMDATHLTRAERAPYFEIARGMGCAVEAVYFSSPLEVCMVRNQARTRRVPDEVLRTMAAKLEVPGLEEGFAEITVVTS